MSNTTRGTRRLVTLLVLGASLGGMVVTVSPASAVEPRSDFAVFKQCPRFTKGVLYCLYSETTSGSATIGSATTPIDQTIILQGGISENPATEQESFVGAANGETLSKTPQNVPGGLAGLVNCTEIANAIERAACKLVFETGLTGVTETTELTKPAADIGINTDNLLNGEGTALSLPVRIHLENPLLGSGCYIGSSEVPIVLELTSGTTAPPLPNEPISGNAGKLTFKDELKLTELTNDTLVDNAFAAPEASGCGGLFAAVLDPVIDAKLSLPSPSGHNTIIEHNRILQATAENVIASEA